MKSTSEIVSECKALLEQHYGRDLASVVLFGSTARGQDSPESDIDLLVVLNRPFQFGPELESIIDVLYPLQLTCSRLLSAKPAFVDDYRSGKMLLYRNASREGINV